MSASNCYTCSTESPSLSLALHSKPQTQMQSQVKGERNTGKKKEREMGKEKRGDTGKVLENRHKERYADLSVHLIKRTKRRYENVGDFVHICENI